MAKLPIPTIRDRTAYAFNRSTTTLAPFGLQGSAVSGSTGGTVANGTTYREVLCVAGHAAARVRLLTVTSTGTLTLTPIRPEVVTAGVPDESVYTGTGLIDPSKVVKYTTGGASKAVAAATECVVDLALSGENYVLVEFACTANGTITYCDAMSIDFATVIPAAQTGGASSLGGTSSTSATLVSLPGDWSLSNFGAVASSSGVTKVAGGAGVRHVCTSISATFTTGATAQATPANLQLLDNSVPVWGHQFLLPANGVWSISISGLNIVGVANAAMQLILSAGVAGSFGSTSLTGHDAA